MVLTTKNKQPLGESTTARIPEDSLLVTIADKYCRNIIRSTIDHPKSAVELADTCEMPLNTVYRKLRFLVKNKIMMRTSAVITSDGKKIFLYQSRISDIKVHHVCRSLEVEVIPNFSVENVNTGSGQSCPVCKLLFGNDQTI